MGDTPGQAPWTLNITQISPVLKHKLQDLFHLEP